ncbi:MAG: DsrE family protein [Gemmatimonadaceae bacterium]
MSRTPRLLILAVALVVPGLAAAQAGEALIRQLGAGRPIAEPSFPAPHDLVYRFAWHVTDAPETPAGLVDGFRRPANMLVMMDENGVPRRNVHLAIIVHGLATRSLLRNDAYRAATGADNTSIALLEALHAAGVEIIVCGAALVNRNVPRDQLLPFVKVATTATMAHAILAAQGYEVASP